jgi:hypothetical protein
MIAWERDVGRRGARSQIISRIAVSLPWSGGVEHIAMAKRTRSKPGKKKRKLPKSAGQKKTDKAKPAKKAATKKASAKRPPTRRAQRHQDIFEASLASSNDFAHGSLSGSLADHVFALASAGQVNAHVREFVVPWLNSRIPAGFKPSDPLPDFLLSAVPLQAMLSQLVRHMQSFYPSFDQNKFVNAKTLINETSGKLIGFFIAKICDHARIAGGLEA